MTARSLDGSAPTTFAVYVAPPPKPTWRLSAPATTWSLVTMSPCLSMTKPEPSDWTCCVWAGEKTEGCVLRVSCAVMTTTPGSSCL